MEGVWKQKIEGLGINKLSVYIFSSNSFVGKCIFHCLQTILQYLHNRTDVLFQVPCGSHQYVCSTASRAAPQVQHADYLTEDGWPIGKIFPEGVTAFIRLLPGSHVPIRVTVLHGRDADILPCALSLNEWRACPGAAFVRHWEFVLDSESQVVVRNIFL
jgi:hypothetical protein